MQVVAGAVQGIDDPDAVVVPGFATFFTQKGMIGVIALNFPYNFRFTGTVHFADVIMPGLAFNGNGVHVLYLAAHDIAGSVGGFDSDIEYRMRHVR